MSALLFILTGLAMMVSIMLDVWVKYGRFDDEAMTDHFANMPLEKLILLQLTMKTGVVIFAAGLCLRLRILQ